MGEDIKLLVSNAHAFFGATSTEGEDANSFEEAFNKEVQKLQSQSPASKAPSVASTSSTGKFLTVLFPLSERFRVVMSFDFASSIF